MSTLTSPLIAPDEETVVNDDGSTFDVDKVFMARHRWAGEDCNTSAERYIFCQGMIDAGVIDFNQTLNAALSVLLVCTADRDLLADWEDDHRSFKEARREFGVVHNVVPTNGDTVEKAVQTADEIVEGWFTDPNATDDATDPKEGQT